VRFWTSDSSSCEEGERGPQPFCYFKMEPGPACAAGPGALYKPYVDPDMLAWWAREKVKFCQIIHEIIQANCPEYLWGLRVSRGHGRP
jgi:hypothetical protein